MAIDEQYVALPKLYGAPAYARPAPPAEETPRPFDPDDLPIEAVQTLEERDLASTLPAHSYEPANSPDTKKRRRFRKNERLSLRPKPLSLRALAGRILGNDRS